jgi:hypothetical protein
MSTGYDTTLAARSDGARDTADPEPPATPPDFPDPAADRRPAGPFGTPDPRPDLAGTMLHLPPGQWWSPDGWLHVEVEQTGHPAHHSDLPDGWVWVRGTLYLDGEGVDTCTVPVRFDALPPAPGSPGPEAPSGAGSDGR